MIVHLPLLTTSRARAFRACHRLHYYSYELGFRPAKTADALRFGTLMHKALEAWWRSGLLSNALDEIKKAEDEYERAKAEALMFGYHARWSGQGQELDVIDVEREFAAPLVNPLTGRHSRVWRFGGKIDSIVRRRSDGRVFVVEHKTTNEDISQGSVYWRRLRMDPQISNYLVGARSLGFDAVGVIYDVLSKPLLRPLQVTKTRKVAETPIEYRNRILDSIRAEPDAYFARAEVVRLDHEAADAAYDLWSTAREIRDAQYADRHVRNPDHCMHWGRACEFLDVCTGSAELTNPTRFRKVENVNEELGNAG